MMKAHGLLLLAAVCVLALSLALPVHGQSGIVVTGAAAVREESAAMHPGLNGILSSMGPRVSLWNANTVRHQPITAPPSALQGILSQVQPRVIFLTANANRHAGLSAPPSALQNLFSAVQPRVIIHAAKANRSRDLSYPVVLIGDNTPPQVSAISSSRQGGTAIIRWVTNEFANSAVLYGTQSGNLTQTIADPLYVRQHELTLTGLAPGVTYFYRVRSIDLSGNPTLSEERVLPGQSLLFVPNVQRSR